jgi:hypothetical protein
MGAREMHQPVDPLSMLVWGIFGSVIMAFPWTVRAWWSQIEPAGRWPGITKPQLHHADTVRIIFFRPSMGRLV